MSNPPIAGLAKPDLPVATFIRSGHARLRTTWYNDHKKKALAAAGQRSIGDRFTKTPVADFVGIVDKLATGSGLNIHFAIENPGSAEFVLLFVSADKDYRDVGEYYPLYTNGQFGKPLSQQQAHTWIENYQSGIKPILHCTTTQRHGETDLIHFKQGTIMEIKAEFDYQYRGGKIESVTIQISSFADRKAEKTITRSNDPTYLQRLTVMFSFADKGGQPLDFEDIDRERYNETIALQDNPVTGSYDTGLPMPPPLGWPD